MEENKRKKLFDVEDQMEHDLDEQAFTRAVFPIRTDICLKILESFILTGTCLRKHRRCMLSV